MQQRPAGDNMCEDRWLMNAFGCLLMLHFGLVPTEQRSAALTCRRCELIALHQARRTLYVSLAS
jgi:hypothetical protein